MPVFLHLSCQASHVVFLCDVAGERESLAPRAPDLFFHFFQFIRAPAHQIDYGAVLRQGNGDLRAEGPSRSGDHRAFSFKEFHF